jgi:hypothetical protein
MTLVAVVNGKMTVIGLSSSDATSLLLVSVTVRVTLRMLPAASTRSPRRWEATTEGELPGETPSRR